MLAPVLLAIGLAMDAVAVSAARGLAAPAIRPRHVVRVALLFGGFQALMPALGWALGDRLGPAFARWDHWVAFGLLAAIGGKMLLEALRDDGAPLAGRDERALFGWRVLLVLAVATSVDAFAAGITLPLFGAPPAVTLALIGGITAVLSAGGLVAGRQLGAHAGRRLDVVGGVVLIGLGTKILLEHTLG